MNVTPFFKSSTFVFIIFLFTLASIIAADAVLEPNEAFINSQRDQAISHIQKGEYQQADAIVTALATNHPGSHIAGNCIWRIAAQYLSSGEHNKARQLCEMALITWPNHSEYKDTVSKLAEISLRDEGFDNAVAVTNALIGKYPENKNMIRDYLRREASHFARYGHVSQAQKMSQAFLGSSAGVESNVWDQAGMVSSYLILGDTSKAEAAITRMLSDFARDKDFAEVVNWLAGEYFKASDSAKAIQLYQVVLSLAPSTLSKHPTSHFKLRAHKGLALIHVSLGNTSKVDEELSIIERDHPEEFGFDEAVYEIAEDYYLRAEAFPENDQEQARTQYSRAAAIWQRNINQFDDPRRWCKANYYSGFAYQKLNQHDDAISCFQHIVSRYPDYEKAWNAQLMIIVSIDQLCQQGLISRTDAKTRIAEANRLLQERYPDSKIKTVAEKITSRYSI